VDARLLAPAAAAWAAVALTLLACSTWPSLTLPFGLVAVLVAAAALILPKAMPVRVVMLACAFGVLLSALHVHARHLEPLASWIRMHATVEATAVVTGDPVSRMSPNAPAWLASRSTSIAIRVTSLRDRDSSISLNAPMELRLSSPEPAPVVGSAIALRMRLAPAPWNRDLAAYATASGNVRVLRSPGPVNAIANSMRAGLRDSTQGLSDDSASLISGLAVGDVSEQPEALSQSMRTAGLTHLTAVSGGNVAIVIAAVLLVTSRLRLRRRIRVGVALAALVFFVILVRPQPSVIRAAVMCALVILGMLTGGRRAGPAVLCASVLILLGLEPGLAVSYGFALSVAATAGLIVISPRVERYLVRARVSRRWPPALREAVAIAASAQIATLPVLIAMGAGLGVMSIPANLLAMPAVAPVTILGLLAALTATIAMPVAVVLTHLAAPFAWWIAHVATTVSALPGAHLGWPAGITGVLLLAVVAVGAWWVRKACRRRWPSGVPAHVAVPALAMCCVLIAVLIVAPPGRRGWPPANWRLVMCDVGQGDALVLHDSHDDVVVVDAGPDPALIDSCLADLGISSIDTVLLTHFHADHVNGLPGVLRGRQVRQVLVTSIEEPPEQASFVHRTLADAGLTAIVEHADDRGVIGAISWRALWPRRRLESGSVPNNASVVLLADVEGVTMLLTGDVEPEAQAAIIEAEPEMHVDVMKVPHHGSRYQDPRLPSWSHARLALISVGEGNMYGHPAPETVAAWRQVGALVARTDTEGDLAVVGETEIGVVARGH